MRLMTETRTSTSLRSKDYSSFLPFSISRLVSFNVIVVSTYSCIQHLPLRNRKPQNVQMLTKPGIDTSRLVVLVRYRPTVINQNFFFSRCNSRNINQTIVRNVSRKILRRIQFLKSNNFRNNVYVTKCLLKQTLSEFSYLLLYSYRYFSLLSQSQK